MLFILLLTTLEADLLATKMSISIVNDQFQPQAQLPQVQTQAPQVHYQAPEVFRILLCFLKSLN